MIFNSNILILRVEILILEMLKLGGNMKHKVLSIIKGTSHSNDFNNKHKLAFTLAEVLITLGVIGVVASITMPTVIKEYQKHITVSKLKKAYTNLQNAIQMSISENGDMSTWDFSENNDYSGTESKEFFDKYIVKYYKKLKNYHVYNSEVRSIDGLNPVKPEWITLTDGTSIGVTIKGRNSMWIYIDINEQKLPNKLGKDVFLIAVLPKENSLKFYGQGLTNERLVNPENIYSCNKNTNQPDAGGLCGAKILQDGWKISDDYPW